MAVIDYLFEVGEKQESLISTMFREILLVALGGAIGSVLRFVVGVHLPTSRIIPMPTIFVNVIGCLIVGFIYGALSKSGANGSTLYTFAAIGFCGGFTTMSAFSLETVNLMRQADLATAFLYLMLTMAGCTAATFIGIIIGRNVSWI